MVNDLLNSFNNRELAALVWLTIFVIVMSFSGKIRRSFWGALDASFYKTFLILFTFLFIYVFGLILLLKQFSFWEFPLLKDTMFWLVGIAIPLTFSGYNAKDFSYFRKIILDSFKLIIFLEFLFNTYVFNLAIELLILPIIATLFVLKTVVEIRNVHVEKGPIINRILNFVGWILIAFVAYKTISGWKELLVINSVKSILLAPILTLLFLPFVYLIAVYVSYENLFVRYRNLMKDHSKKRLLRITIFRVAKLNLNKLNRIALNFSKYDLIHSSDMKKYIASISLKSRSDSIK